MFRYYRAPFECFFSFLVLTYFLGLFGLEAPSPKGDTFFVRNTPLPGIIGHDTNIHYATAKFVSFNTINRVS